MIYQRQFLKETTITAIAVFVVILAILVFTQGITLLGRAAGGNVAIDAVGTLIGFWVLNLAPLLLVLTAYISTLTVLTRYWRDSEMAIWLSSGLGLRQWVKPVMTFALPLMLLTAIAIRLESAGSVLFVQNRVGQGGREFKIYKFRSMRTDSEQNGAQLAQVGDSRITRVGSFIRKTRLDELPQFFNILKGDMSLIGPRPEQKVFVEQFEKSIPFYQYRHIVKPGLSGWAQVTQGYAGNTDETQVKIEHDFYYIKHFSFSLDVLIMFKTVKIILTGFGAR